MKEKGVILFIAVFVIISSCNNDDSTNVEVIPPRPLAEVEAENDATIIEYLKTHYYNYEEFENHELMQLNKKHSRLKGEGRPTKKERRDIEDYLDES